MHKSFCPVSDDEPNLPLLLRRIREAMSQHLERGLGALGAELTFTQYLVLKNIATEGPLTAGELARRLDHNAGAMTRLIDRLEAKGYVRRQPDAEDRRALRIALTEAGQAQWHAISRCSEDVQRLALSDLNEAERNDLLSLLQRVRDTLENHR
ncbi:MAG TPA: MarR family transcriptional regulator [Dokdonella sp.]